MEKNNSGLDLFFINNQNGADPAPRRRHALLLVLPRLCSQGYTPVWRKRHHMPDGDREEALVHIRMLPGARQRHNDLGRGGGDGGAAEGGRVDCYGRIQGGPREDGRPGTGREYCSGGGDCRPRRYGRVLIPATAGVMQVSEDAVGGEASEGSAVPDRLYPGI